MPVYEQAIALGHNQNKKNLGAGKMSCFICGRNSCMPSFHSLEEQSYFEKAEEAYDRYLEILEECRGEWASRDVEQQEPQ